MNLAHEYLVIHSMLNPIKFTSIDSVYFIKPNDNKQYSSISSMSILKKFD